MNFDPEKFVAGLHSYLDKRLKPTLDRLAAVEKANGINYRGLWKPGAFRKGDSVYLDGLLWKASGPTNSQPGLDDPTWKMMGGADDPTPPGEALKAFTESCAQAVREGKELEFSRVVQKGNLVGVSAFDRDGEIVAVTNYFRGGEWSVIDQSAAELAFEAALIAGSKAPEIDGVMYAG